METQVPITIVTHDHLCIERPPHVPTGIVIFGASGDLAYRKLYPAIFDLFERKLMPENFFVLGASRTVWDDAEFRKRVGDSLKARGKTAGLEKFLEKLHYRSCEYGDARLVGVLGGSIRELAQKHKTGDSVLFYLAIPPEVYAPAVKALAESGLLACGAHAPARVVIEKPFGKDMGSARELSARITSCMGEGQVYRIDHYLGKETVQNILMFRFANRIFEPVWNNRYIDNVQITAAETLGIEHRAGYYESTGALKDMFQNHMLELLALVAMEPPLDFTPDLYRDEKAKVVKAVRHDRCVVGQYGPGELKGKKAHGYKDEPGVSKDSKTETYAALKLFVDNWRWEGVPFYLRSGKRLARNVTEIVIEFKHVPHSIFSMVQAKDIPPNILRMRIQPNEGISLGFEAKHPGPKMCMATLALDFCYSEVFKEKPMDAYSRLILDCLNSDPTLFVRQDMVEASWEFIAGVTQAVRGAGQTPVAYAGGTWGPKEAEDLIEKDGRTWRTV